MTWLHFLSPWCHSASRLCSLGISVAGIGRCSKTRLAIQGHGEHGGVQLHAFFSISRGHSLWQSVAYSSTPGPLDCGVCSYCTDCSFCDAICWTVYQTVCRLLLLQSWLFGGLENNSCLWNCSERESMWGHRTLTSAASGSTAHVWLKDLMQKIDLNLGSCSIASISFFFSIKRGDRNFKLFKNFLPNESALF